MSYYFKSKSGALCAISMEEEWIGWLNFIHDGERAAGTEIKN
jgi:hypothetical protein